MDGTELERTAATAGGAVAVGAADQDGDGRSDISSAGGERRADGGGRQHRHRSLGGAWWIDPNYECDDDPVPLEWNGTFHDDDDSEFEGDIELVAELGITRGCNPPFADAFCPRDRVTRGQMAAFLVRMFSFPPTDRGLLLRRRILRVRGRHQPAGGCRYHGGMHGIVVLSRRTGHPGPDGRLPGTRPRSVG
jgi:hypothetical protein